MKKTSTHLRLAEEAVSRLQKAGHTALFAGGWVRDFLMGRSCQDIDIATSAHPEEVIALFPRSVAVGVQFGVVRVLLDSHEFEVATFRSDSCYVDGRRPEKVDLTSSPEEDAKRRDFTVNGLFYDPIAKQVYDYVEGQQDISRQVIRAIGCPLDRFLEDRLRMIRAIRFKNVLGFTIESDTWKAICQESSHVLPAVSPERIWQELSKMYEKSVLAACLCDMDSCGLLATIFPPLISSKQLSKRVGEIGSYSGQSLVAAICLLFIDDHKAYLDKLADEYHLSRKEKAIIDLFVRYSSLHGHLSDTELVALYAKPGCEDYLAAMSCLRSDPAAFLARHQHNQERLAFWTDQLKTKNFLVSGADLQQRGIKPGVLMGQLLEQAFDLSIEKQIKDKQTLLDTLLP